MSSGFCEQFSLGDAAICVQDGSTCTTFADGSFVDACHDDIAGLGQDATARALGYPTVVQMNRDHDVCHSVLAALLGLPWSPVLHALAHGTVSSKTDVEEEAVLAFQRFAVAYGVNMVSVAMGLARLLQGARHA